MQKAWAKTETRGHALSITHHHSQSLQHRFMLGIHLDITKQSEVIAIAQTSEMSAKVISQRSARRTRGRSPLVGGFRQVRGICFIGEKFEAGLIDDRFFGGKRAFALVLGGELIGYALAG